MQLRLFAGFLLFLCAFVARADIGVIDDVPATTLLIPYFEVEPGDPEGIRTIVTLQNTSASAGVVRVTLWTDLGLPTASFNLYMTGYDAETINLRSIFNRIVPFTADDGDDPLDSGSPDDGISNQGPISQDINFPGLGYGSAEALAASIGESLHAAHTGAASDEYFGGLCGARNFGDGIARGFITIDDMITQTVANHLDPGYTAANASVLGTRNIWTADYLIVDPARGEVQADRAVHIEGTYFDPRILPGGSGPTFYGRFTGYDNVDQREPLPTAWIGRVANGRTQVQYWRDPGNVAAPFACGGAPLGVPSGQRAATVFGADGAVLASPGGNLFPFMSGSVDGAAFGAAPALGALFANLNLPGPAIRQSWVTFRQTPTAAAAGSGPSYAVSGIPLGQAIDADDPTAPQN